MRESVVSFSILQRLEELFRDQHLQQPLLCKVERLHLPVQSNEKGLAELPRE
jgi:hypothetical protein